MAQASSSSLDPEILSRLYLHAVLPALETLPQIDSETRKLLQSKPVSVKFNACAGPTSTIHFEPDSIRVSTQNESAANIHLYFLSCASLNKTFSNKGFSIPVPLRGWFRLLEMRRVDAITKRMKVFLEPDSKGWLNPEIQRGHVHLALGVTARAVSILSQFDPQTQAALRYIPKGLARFESPETKTRVFMHWDGKQVYVPNHEPSAKPDVTVTFNNLETAVAAVRNQLDPLTALGLGTLKVHGLVPLADGLNLVMERVSRILQ